MNWKPDPQDFNVFDRRETVTLVRIGSDGSTLASYGGIDAIPEALVTANAVDVGGAQMTPQVVVWHLKAVDLPVGITPDRLDRIVSLSESYAGTWVIKDGDAATDRIRVQVRTQKLIDP